MILSNAGHAFHPLDMSGAILGGGRIGRLNHVGNDSVLLSVIMLLKVCFSSLGSIKNLKVTVLVQANPDFFSPYSLVIYNQRDSFFFP